MVDVFYEEKHLNNIGGAVQVPLVDVSLVSTLVVVTGKQGGSHNLPRRSKYGWISPLRGRRAYRGFLAFAAAPVHVRPDNAVGPDQPKHGRADV